MSETDLLRLEQILAASDPSPDSGPVNRLLLEQAIAIAREVIAAMRQLNAEMAARAQQDEERLEQMWFDRSLRPGNPY